MIKSTGFFRNKSKSIVGAAKIIVEKFGGKVPQTMAELLTVPGAARKTANVVLGSWFGIAEGVVVDTHVHRISRRLELTRNDDAPKIEQDLMKVIPRDRWILFSHQVIHHGRSLCIARNPKCAECPLENVCHAEVDPVGLEALRVDPHKVVFPFRRDRDDIEVDGCGEDRTVVMVCVVAGDLGSAGNGKKGNLAVIPKLPDEGFEGLMIALLLEGRAAPVDSGESPIELPGTDFLGELLCRRHEKAS
jgi:hypothetical protein